MDTRFQIVTDSSCDLPQALADELGIWVQPLHFLLDGRQYDNDLDGRSIGFPEFYHRLKEGAAATTSAPNPAEFAERMRPALESGADILFIGFSSGLSTSYQSGCIAAQELREQFPARRIVTIDSLCASLGQGLFVYLAAQKQRTGATLSETEAYLLELRPHICHWFTVNDLMHLKRGGRIGAASAVMGAMLQIKPIMHMDNEGHLAPVTRVKGRKAALRALAQKALETGIDLPEQTIFICHGDCVQDAQFVADCIREGSAVRDTVIHFVGPTIGAHTGPGVVSVFFVGTER